MKMTSVAIVTWLKIRNKKIQWFQKRKTLVLILIKNHSLLLFVENRLKFTSISSSIFVNIELPLLSKHMNLIKSRKNSYFLKILQTTGHSFCSSQALYRYNMITGDMFSRSNQSILNNVTGIKMLQKYPKICRFSLY